MQSILIEVIVIVFAEMNYTRYIGKLSSTSFFDCSILHMF